MQVKIDAYIAYCDKGVAKEHYDMKRKTVVTIEAPIAYTLARMSLFLGFSCWAKIEEGYNKKAGFGEVITRARTLVEADILEGTMSGRYPPVTAPFRLINMNPKEYQSINSGNQINIGIGVDLGKCLNRANVGKLSHKTADTRKLQEVN